jgi:hypothetical protein
MNPTEEPRPAFTVDFGDALLSHILEASKTAGISKSQLVRQAVEYYLSHNNVVKRTVGKGRELGKKEAVSKLIDTYNNTYYRNATPPRQFFPALYKTYNNAIKGGLTLEEMCDIVKYSEGESLVADGLKKGNKPSLPYLLSSGMIPRILVVVHQKLQKKEKISESDFAEYKYDIVDEHAGSVDFSLRDEFISRVMEAKSRAEIAKVIGEYDNG